MVLPSPPGFDHLVGRLTALQLTRANDNRIAIRGTSHVRRWPPVCPEATEEWS